MITPKEWLDACKKDDVIYYEDCGVAFVKASHTKLFFVNNECWVDYGLASVPLTSLFKSEKECAIEHINHVKKTYGV